MNHGISEVYLYKPVDSLLYCEFSVYNGNTLFVNRILNKHDKDFFSSYLLKKKEYGKLLEFQIIKNEYKYIFLPLWDYGYNHSITMKIWCKYENIEIEETFEICYWKKKRLSEILNSVIIENPIKE